MSMYKTHDFYLACFLRCIGYELRGTERVGSRVVFEFGDDPQRQVDVMSYFNDKGTVRPLHFVRTIRDMKSLVHTAG